MRRLTNSYKKNDSKKSGGVKVVNAEQNGCVLIINQQSEDVTRVLNLIDLALGRFVIHKRRQVVMWFFLKLMLEEERNGKKIGIRKLAQLLEQFFDFRRFDNPNLSVNAQTIETELYNIKRRLEGKE